MQLDAAGHPLTLGSAEAARAWDATVEAFLAHGAATPARLERTLALAPGWLQENRPSPTGRLTFTSWRLWKKDAPLLPSGLLGPVRVLVRAEVAIPVGSVNN